MKEICNIESTKYVLLLFYRSTLVCKPYKFITKYLTSMDVFIDYIFNILLTTEQISKCY